MTDRAGICCLRPHVQAGLVHSSAGSVAQRISDELSLLGVDVESVAPRPPRFGRRALRLAETRLGIPVRGVAMRRIAERDPAFDGRLVLQMFRSDVSRPRGVACATFDDATVIQTLHGGGFGLDARPGRSMESWIRRQADWYSAAVACFALTDWQAGSMVDDYGVDPGKIVVVGSGRNLEFGEDVGRARDWAVPRFLWVAADWERKNGPRVVEAFREVRGRFPVAELHLVGRHPDFVEPGVIGHGVIDRKDPDGFARLERIFGDCTCLVAPSLWDPAGAVYVEAASVGMPQIGADNGGSKDLIGDGGLVVDPVDVRSIADAMLRMCDPTVAASLGRSGRSRARAASWASIARTIHTTLVERGAIVAPPPPR